VGKFISAPKLTLRGAQLILFLFGLPNKGESDSRKEVTRMARRVPRMTKQHFTLIAQAVSEAAHYLRNEASWLSDEERLTADQIVRTVANFLARRLAETNPLFSYRRFYDACGLN
jgi:hypothetical protein